MRKWSEIYFFFFLDKQGKYTFEQMHIHVCFMTQYEYLHLVVKMAGWMEQTPNNDAKHLATLSETHSHFFFSPSFSLYLFQPLQTSFYLTPLLSLFVALLMLHSIARWSIVQSGYFSTSNLNVSQLGTVRTPAANGCLCVKSQNFTGNWSNELTHTRRERRIGLTLHSCKDFYEAHINWTGRLRTQMPQ